MYESEKEQIKTDLADGAKIKAVSERYTIKLPQLKKMFSAYEWGLFAKARKEASKGREKDRLKVIGVERRLYPVQDRPIMCFEKFIAYKQPGGVFSKGKHKGEKRPDKLIKALYEELVGKVDLWFYQNKPAKIGTTILPVTEDSRLRLRGYASQNIPYIEYNPAKRIHDTCHAIYRRKSERLNRELKAYPLISNWVELLTPEEPEAPTLRHDVNTLNAKIGFAEGLNDRLLTQEDGCIISKAFSERGIYRFIEGVHFLRTAKDLPKTVHIKAGVTLTNAESEDIKDNTRVKFNGKITFKEPHQLKDKLWLYRGLMEVVQPLRVGDKLRSLSGMKCIIAEVKEGLECDILIHPNQVVKSEPKNTKGSMVKEMQEHGRVMVGMREDEIGGKLISIWRGSSISAYLYPVLKIWANDVVKAMVKENAVFNDYLRAVHLRYNIDTGKIEVTTPDKEEGEGYKDLPHYQYRLEGEGYHNEVQESDLSGNKDEYQVFSGYKRTVGGDRQKMQHLRWEKLFIAEFIGDGFYRRADWEPPLWKQYEGAEFDEDNALRNPLYKKAWITNEQRALGQKPGSLMDTFLMKKGLFPKVKEGVMLTAIPTTKTDTVTLSTEHKERLGDEIIIWREPVVGKNNVYSAKVEYNDELPINCIKVPLDMVKAANGDYDGDAWTAAPYAADELRKEAHESMPEQEVANMMTIDINKVELVKRSRDELIYEALEELRRFRRSKKDTEDFGGLRKHASFSTDNIETQKEILKYGYYAEVDLKPERREDKKAYEAKLAAKKRLEEIRDEQAKPYHETIDKMIETIPGTRKVNECALIGAMPSGFWFDLLGLPLTQKEQLEEELIARLRAEKTISLWGGGIVKKGGNEQ